MPLFEYTALNHKGKSVKGVVDAESESQVRSILRADNKYPVSIKEGADNRKQSFRSRFTVNLFQNIRPEEIYIMTRQLATLLGAAIPLVPALSSLVDQVENKALKRVLANIKEEVNEGATLTKALSSYPKLFSSVYVNMVRAGETSGSLDVVLDRLADFGEKQLALRGRLKAALIYPLIMAVIGSAVLFILITYVVPNITQVFDDMGKALPPPTRFLIGTSEFFQDYWWVVLLLIALTIVVVKFFSRQPVGRKFIDLVKLKIPVVGPVYRKVLLARFASTLGSLIRSGVDLIVGMHIVNAMVSNVRIAEVIDNATEAIEKGNSMAGSLSQSPWFPPMFVQMVSVGEESGTLEDMLEKVSEAYEREVEYAIMGMTSLIEPLMIVFMGGIVMFIVMSILLPIFEMNQLVG